MKKYLVLALIIIALLITACTKDNEKESGTEAPTESASESEAPTEEPETNPPSPGYIEYTYPELSNDPVYDSESGILKLYFVDYIIWKNTDAECTVGIVNDDGAYSVAAYSVYENFPDMRIDTDLYSGVALKLDEKIDAGDYKFIAIFGTYRVEFEITVK